VLATLLRTKADELADCYPDETNGGERLVIPRKVVAAWLDDDCSITGVFVKREREQQLGNYDPE